MSKPYPVLVLKKGREFSVIQRHPWLFSRAIQSIDGKPANGETVEVRSHSGAFLGIGHYFDSSIAVKFFSFEKFASEEQHISEVFSRACAFRRWMSLLNFSLLDSSLLDSSVSDACRLVHGEADGLPGLIVDKYGRSFVIQFQTSGFLPHQQLLMSCLEREFPGAVDVVFARYSASRLSSKSGDAAAITETSGEFLKGDTPDTVIFENGRKYSVNWQQGQKTGFFLDQRDNRQLVSQYSRGKLVLDAFCYSGGFSMAALAGGAAECCAVDSGRICEHLVNTNYALNFSGDSVGSAAHPPGKLVFEQSDVFDFLEKQERKYEVLVIDPPAFVKRASALKSGLRGYEGLNCLAFRACKKQALVFTFSCSQLVSRDMFQKVIFEAAFQAKRNVRIVKILGQAACHPASIYHPEGDYLKGLMLAVD